MTLHVADTGFGISLQRLGGECSDEAFVKGSSTGVWKRKMCSWEKLVLSISSFHFGLRKVWLLLHLNYLFPHSCTVIH